MCDIERDNDRPTILQTMMVEEKGELFNGSTEMFRRVQHQLEYSIILVGLETPPSTVQALHIDADGGSRFDGGDGDLDTVNGIIGRNLALDGISGTRRHSHELHHLPVQFCDAVKPELALVGRVNHDIVLNGLLLLHEFGTAESGGEGFHDGLTTDGIDTSKIDLDGEWTG